MGYTFSEKIFSQKSGSDVRAGDIVFAKPDLVLSHDNSSSIAEIFSKMGGKNVKYPETLIIILDHDAPPTTIAVANDHRSIRKFVKNQGVQRFYDVGNGICHQLISNHVLPNMLIVGSDSHTCTSGAFNTFAAGIDRTETAGIWLTGKTWFRVPETIKIELQNQLQEGVYAKDIALWIIGLLGSSGANYMAIEFHGDGIESLSISERMTIANLASEMGAKTAVFPPDNKLNDWINNRDQSSLEYTGSLWADEDAIYYKQITLDLSQIQPVVALPHQVDNVKVISQVDSTPIEEIFLGTCTNGRLEDLEIAASILKGKKIHPNVQFLVAPASKEIFRECIQNGIIDTLVESGATILTSSCGPCLGKGQGIPPDGCNVLSTANRNFYGRMGNKAASIFLASPATVAVSALSGEIEDPRAYFNKEIVNEIEYPEFQKEDKEQINEISSSDDRFYINSWDYSDINNFNTDQMFEGKLTYDIKSSMPDEIVPHLFKGLDGSFAGKAKKGDIIVAGDNFGCGSSREHPAVGLSALGIKAVIVKSVSRIFYRAAINQGLPIIVNREIVDKYDNDYPIQIDFETGNVMNGSNSFSFQKLPEDFLAIFQAGGLIKYYKNRDEKVI